MSRNVAELRKKAQAGNLSEAEEAYVRDREGIGYWTGVQGLLDEPSFEDEDPEDAYSSWTNDELRDELESRDLATSGNKDDLVQRLVESDEARAESE